MVAFGASALSLCVAVLWIHFQRNYEVGSARVMVQSYALSGEGVAQANVVGLDGEHRNLPVDWTIRLTSAASVRAALENSGNPADSTAVAGVRKNLHARLVPGSTVIEINFSGNDQMRLIDFLESLLNVQDQLWNSPERKQTVAILEELSRHEAELRGQITKSSAEIAGLQAEMSIGSAEVLSKLDSAEIQVSLAKSRTEAELSAVERLLSAGNVADETAPVLLSGERREIARARSDVDAAEAQLAALKTRYGSNHHGVIEQESRLAMLKEKQKSYVEFERKRLTVVKDILGSTALDLQSDTEESIQTVLDDRRRQSSSDYLTALANLDAAQNQMEWIAQERQRVSLYYKGLMAPLVILDSPSIRDGFQRTMKRAQYGMAVIGAIFIWFACIMLLDAWRRVRSNEFRSVA